MRKYKILVSLFAAVFSLVVNTSVALADDSVSKPEFMVQSTDERIAYIDEQTNVALQFVVRHGERLYFDFDAAKNAGVSGEALDIGLMIETVSEDYSNKTFVPSTYFRSVSWPVHGNYCGPGHSGNNFTLEPTDLLDWGCREHDRCYKPWSPGQNCDCNRQLVEFIAINRRYMPENILWKANAIKSYFERVGLLGC